MRSDLYRTETVDLTNTPAKLPVFVRPEQDEALCSWFFRLAAKLDVPVSDLARRAFGLSRPDPHWWRRPTDDDLHQIAEKVDIDSHRIRTMTLHDWTVARDDELSRRFQPGRSAHTTDRGPLNRPIALCRACLATGNCPYIRREWMVGWVGVCAVHRVALEEHCRCGDRMRLPGLGTRSTVEIGVCPRCDASVIGGAMRDAHAVALAAQGEMLAIKCAGFGRLRGVGDVTWPMLVALADLIGALLWKGTTDFAREDLFQIVADDLGLDRLATDWATNNGILLVLGWLFERWTLRLPMMMEVLDSPPAATLARELLEGDPESREGLLGCLPSAALELGHGPPAWRVWLDTLPPRSAMIARARNARDIAGDRYATGHMRRTSTFADLRDGASIEKVAERHGYKVSTIERLLDFARRYGIDILFEGPIRRDDLREDEWDLIASWIDKVERRPSAHGWSPMHAQAEVRSRFGITISLSVAREMLWGMKPTNFRTPRRLQRLKRGFTVKEPVHG